VAKIRLQGYGGPVEGLPAVCLRCGAPASVLKRKTFSWFPGWIYVLLVTGLLPFAIVAIVLTRRRTVEAPLCEEHKNHWLIRQGGVWGSFLLLLLLGFGSFAALVGTEGRDSVAGFLCFGWLIGLVGWIVLAAVIQATSIRPVKITDTTITLVGVSKEFVEAYQGQLPRLAVDNVVSERWQQSRSWHSHSTRQDAQESDRVQPPGNDTGRTPPPDAYSEEAP